MDSDDGGNAVMGRLPLLASFVGYRAGWLKSDIPAGLAIAAVGLPSAIAYPAIAGLPPETGLYASIAPLVAYAVFGPSRQLIVGPDAATITVMAAVLASMPELAATDRGGAAALLALVVGGMYLGGRWLGLGVLANFLSRPILIGFFAGISISIAIGQIGRVTGLRIEADGLISPLIELFAKAGSIHWPSLALALAMFALMQGAQALRLLVPGPVLVVVVSILLSLTFDFQALGIAVVGNIPSGVPVLSLPSAASMPFDRLLLGAAAIFLVSFAAGVVTARSFGARGGYPVDTNAEMVGFGASNIAAGFFGAFPVTASDSRTAINVNVGGKSQLAGVVAAAALLAAVLFLQPALAILPIPALGAILVAAALSLVDIPAMRRLWQVSHVEFAFALIALWGAVSLGVLNGVIIAIAATFAYMLHKMMYPRAAMLGRVPGRDGFYKLHRKPDARAVPGLAICLIEGSLLFFNADHVLTRLRAIADGLPQDARWLVLDASAVAQIDSTAVAMLEEIRGELAARGIALGLAELHADARRLLDRAGFIAAIGPEMVFEDLEDALSAFEKKGGTNDQEKARGDRD